MSGIAKRYANAVFEIISNDKNKQKIAEEIKYFSSLFVNNSELRKTLTNPVFKIDLRSNILKEISKKIGFSDFTLKALTHILKASRISIINEISDILIDKIDKSMNIQKITVITSKKIDETNLKSIKKEIEKVIENKQPLYSYEIDESIIGGVIVKIGDTIYDNSVQTQLKNIKDKIIK